MNKRNLRKEIKIKTDEFNQRERERERESTDLRRVEKI